MIKNFIGKKWTNKGNDKHEDADSLLHDTSHTQCLYKILGAVVPEKSLTKNVTGEKEEWTNKGNDKHEDADSLLHDTTSHTQCLYKVLGAVIPEKPLTQIFVSITLE